MISEREVNATYLSPTKKDFYQIWNELLDTAQKLSVNWDPTSTNESDPGIVLLKVLTGVADKLNYSIDKNILEQFMPSAAQEESMRKLCDMLGYSIKYYQSATTDVTISYTGDIPETVNRVCIPKNSNITNEDGSINYTTLEDAVFTLTSDDSVEKVTSVSVPCIEGTLRECETNNNNIISITHIDDNHRYYLPEHTIAENGIYIYYYSVEIEGESTNPTDQWTKVTNLNTQIAGKPVWKFGYDSKKKMPYVQFPDDIGSIIKDGLKIYYLSTSGENGNVSARTLTLVKGTPVTINVEDGTEYTSEQFSAVNPSAATNGTNIETINQAYNNFKKTIGTFDTLVTCRDYINAIYKLFTEDNIALVSNVVVSDIRDDINRSVTLCGFDEYGICCTDRALVNEVTKTDKKGNTYTIDEAKINNFDLVLYPFKTVYGINNKEEYINSFKYTTENAHEIEAGIKDFKTISHNITYPEETEIVCIKNYLKLKAKITTTKKVNTAEEVLILNNVFTNIYKKFNMRELDFGEEIPYDSILEAIEKADTRIKNVSLDEPELYTVFALANGEEWDFASKADLTPLGKIAYNKLALRNILAGRIALFDYDTSFKPGLTEEKYTNESGSITYEPVYPISSTTQPLIQMTSECDIINSVSNLKLTSNEVVSFRAPSFRTTMTYPGYVNYFINLSETTKKGGSAAIPATFEQLYTYFYNRDKSLTGLNINMYKEYKKEEYGEKYEPIRYNLQGTDTLVKNASGNYVIKFDSTSYVAWANWIKKQPTQEAGENYKGIYRIISTSAANTPGSMIDVGGNKFRICNEWSSSSSSDPDAALKFNYVQETHPDETPDHTKNGLGKDAVYKGILKDSEYRLKDGEYLCINYTEASSTDSNSSKVICKVYETGTIIRPNFELVDSISYNTAGHTYPKDTSKLIFKRESDGTEISLPGMFTLGTNEQIEIREPSAVELTDSVVYVYWTLKNNKKEFPFEEVTETINGKEVKRFVYNLQEDEYFYYTDANKLDLAYYGYGTEVEYHGKNKIKLVKKDTDTEVTAADISAYGITAIPWIKCNFKKPAEVENQSYISLNEFQYVNLTADDTLVSVPASLSHNINNKWQTCAITDSSKVQYKFGDDTTILELPQLCVDTYNWEVRSKLEFNVGPALEQVLHADSQKTDKFSLYTYRNIEERDVENYVDPTPFQELYPDTDTPLSLKSNYICQSSSDTVDTRVTIYESDGKTIKEHKDDFKIHTCKENELTIKGNDDNNAPTVQLHTFGDYWTKITAAELGKEGYLPFYFTIPNQDYALLMIYYMDQAHVDSPLDTAYLTIDTTNKKKKDKNADTSSIKIFNNNNSWWTDRIEAGPKYHLKQGINIVELDSSIKLKLYGDVNQDSIIIFGDPDFIKVTGDNKGLKLSILDYQQIKGEISKADQLLADINEVDTKHEFYYNCILDNSTALDINEDLDEKLSSPSIWYDYNNINNKFVISEINQENMVSGITIAKSSKI